MTIVRSILLGLVLVAATGCVERTITIRSEPTGALVYLNDVEVGRTPTTVPFTFYGKYDVRLLKDGYQTLSTWRNANAPVYDWPGIDLFTEMLPGRQKVELVWDFTLEEAGPIDPAMTIDRGRQLRALLKQEAEAASTD